MAALVVTPAAIAWIRDEIDRENIARPLVSAGWAKGAAELRRGHNGEAMWERERDGWCVGVLDLAELERAGVIGLVSNFEAHGLEFCLAGVPDRPLLEGCTLDARDGKLVVLDETSNQPVDTDALRRPAAARLATASRRSHARYIAMGSGLRFVGSGSKSLPIGRWQKASDGPGRVLQLRQTTEADALNAFDACMRERKAFVLEAPFGASIEFHRTWWGRGAWLDCWSFESELSEATMSIDGARRLVRLLYTECAEADVLKFLLEEGAWCEPKIAI